MSGEKKRKSWWHANINKYNLRMSPNFMQLILEVQHSLFPKGFLKFCFQIELLGSSRNTDGWQDWRRRPLTTSSDVATLTLRTTRGSWQQKQEFPDVCPFSVPFFPPPPRPWAPQPQQISLLAEFLWPLSTLGYSKCHTADQDLLATTNLLDWISQTA